MLSELEFLSWCEKNKFSKSTQDYINNNIRYTQPVRSVGSGRKSTPGKYPSKKMGVYIQWESKSVEGPAVLMMEHDEDVLEYYDQPNKIKLNYVNNNGKKGGTLYTPDYFVIRKNSAGWVEWKSEDDLIDLSKSQPWKYTKDENGEWRCPPGEQFAKQFGLEFKVCTNSLIDWNIHRNFVFLDDYFRKGKAFEINIDILASIKQKIFQEPGLTLKQLIDNSVNSDYYSDDIYIALIKKDIYVDLKEAALAEPEKVQVFLHKEHADMYKNLIKSGSELRAIKISFEVGSKISWDNHIWIILNIGDNNVSLMSDGKYNEVSREIFDLLIREGKIIGEIKEDKANLDDPIIDFITSASEEDYKIANYRLKHVLTYMEKGSNEYKAKKEPNLRKVRDWTSKYRKAQKLFGNGYVGLLPKDKDKGNRNDRFSTDVINLMNDYIKEEYETNVQKSMISAYGAFKNSCKEKGYIAPSYVTFCENIKERPVEEQTKNRKGSRAAYQKETFYWELDRTTPRHGDFPFNICHLDHTELDIELICPRTGKNLGRPHLSLLVDAFSRRVLAFYLTFEQPSYRSCLMVFRDCVRRYNRLPQQIVVDNGKEFHSIYFETLLAMYEKEPVWRPSAKPRHGSVLERLFETTNSSFIHNLKGNTKIMRNVREVTKSVNPKNHAVWSLLELSTALETFFFDLYDTIEHPALGQSPRDAFKQGLFYSGERKEFYIPYDRVFEILTLPSTNTGEATIQQNGVKINYIYYWNEDFKSLHSKKIKVKVRFDPFNIGVAYAYVNKRWVKCISEYYAVFKNMTEKEVKFITSEIKKKKQNHSKNYTINAQRISLFIRELEDNSQYQLLKSKAEENKNVIQFKNLSSTSQEVTEESPSFPDKNSVEKEIEAIINEQDLEVYGEF